MFLSNVSNPLFRDRPGMRYSNHPSLGGAGGEGSALCKGPPGPTRSPGTGNDLFPEHPPDAKAEVMPNFLPARLQAGFRQLIKPTGKPSIPVGAETTHEQTLKTRRLAKITLNTRYALSCLSSEASRTQIRMNLNTEYHYFITTKHKFLTIKFLQS